MTSFGASLRALFGRMGLAVLLCVPVAVGGVVMVNRYIDDQVGKIPRVPLTTAPVGPNGVNFLIIGSDSRSFVDPASAADVAAFTDKNTQNAPPRSDTMMVLHANGNSSFAVSFPRDLWVDIPGMGGAKINAAFNEGPQKVVDTLQSNFNVPINYYLEVNFATFEGIVDAIGTVPVWMPGMVRDTFTGLFVPYGAGCYHLNGASALQWVRARHLEILDPKGTYDPDTGLRWSPFDATADIGRIKRQQDFIKRLGRTAVQRTIDDPLIAPDIVDALLPNLHANASFDRGALNELVRAFLGLTSGDGTGLQFETLPWYDPGKPVGGQSAILVKQPEADAVLAQLRGEAPPPAPTTTVAPSGQATPLRPSDVRVRVLNGSGVTGAAATADQALANLGFVSGGIANYTGAPVARTQIRYRPGDEAKAQLLAGVVTGADLAADASVGTDLVVVLGPGFKGVGASTPKDTAATPTTAPISPEEACQ